MPAFITFGRFLFAVLFVSSGVMGLLQPDGMMPLTEKVVIPTVLAPYAAQMADIAGMPIAKLLAIVACAFELICGLMIAFNFASRFFALILVPFVVATIFYAHDFWNQTGAAATESMIHALKNLSLIGALFIIAGIGRTTRNVETIYSDT